MSCAAPYALRPEHTAHCGCQIMRNTVTCKSARLCAVIHTSYSSPMCFGDVSARHESDPCAIRVQSECVLGSGLRPEFESEMAPAPHSWAAPCVAHRTPVAGAGLLNSENGIATALLCCEHGAQSSPDMMRGRELRRATRADNMHHHYNDLLAAQLASCLCLTYPHLDVSMHTLARISAGGSACS